MKNTGDPASRLEKARTLAEMLFMLLLLVVPGIGTMLGVMSLHGYGRTSWTIGIIVINIFSYSWDSFV